MLNKNLKILIISISLIATGCASNKNQSLKELPELPSDWATPYDGKNEVRGWIESFNDETLPQLINEALLNNRDLRLAAANVKIAKANAGASLAPILPSISIGASKNQISSISDINGNVDRNFTYRESLVAQLNWEIDVWGRLSTRSKAAYVNVKSVFADYDAARLSIAGLTAQAWYLFSEAKLQTDLAERNLQTRISTLKKVENRYQKGIAQSRDLRLARSESESRRADLILRQQTLKESARNLEIIIGRYPSANILPNDLPNLPPGPEIGSPNYVLSNRPDIVSAEAQLEAAGLEVTATRLAFLPSLSLTAQWSTLERNWSDAFDPDRLAGSIIGSLTQSIFQGGRRIAQTQISEQQMKIVLENYAKTLLNAAKEVEDSLYSEEILLERESALSNAFNEAKAAEKLTFDQYNRGIATIFELLDAQSRRLSSESLLINSRLLRITNRIKLHLAISSPLFEENKY
ncbi:MAG: TolC family protein [Pseudomonadota bacterium]|nr:TolC family protein [Pseudomonadota bacterium]